MDILIVDDHQMFRESLIEFLRQEEFCTSVRGAASVQDAREAIIARPPEVLVTDLSFPEGSGQDLLQWIQETHPDIPRMCLTMHAELEVLKSVLRLGVRGYVTKNSGYNELVRAIQVMGGNGVFLDQVILEKVMDEFSRPAHTPYTGTRESDATAETGARRSSLDLTSLTEREREVFNLLLDDHKLQDIAEILYVSAKTVENHRSSIYRKLGVKDRFSLHRRAREERLVP